MIAADPAKYGFLQDRIESPELTGHAIWALLQDPELAMLSGETLIGAELAAKYGITNPDGHQPPSCRDLHGIAPLRPYPLIVR